MQAGGCHCFRKKAAFRLFSLDQSSHHGRGEMTVIASQPLISTSNVNNRESYTLNLSVRSASRSSYDLLLVALAGFIGRRYKHTLLNPPYVGRGSTFDLSHGRLVEKRAAIFTTVSLHVDTLQRLRRITLTLAPSSAAVKPRISHHLVSSHPIHRRPQ
jgi:hypothetical protein